MKKVAIVGSRKFTNKQRIKEFIFKLKEELEDGVEIVSGGQRDGADGYAKKYALEFNLKYSEFPPSHYNHNMYCVLGANSYNKPYYISNYFKRNRQIAEYSDFVVAFIPKDKKSRGTENTISHAKRLNKRIIIIN